MRKKWLFHIDHFETQNLLPGHTAFKTERANPYISIVKEKLFEGEKGVFIGSGKTVFGENGFGSLMAVPMIENDTVFGFAILLKRIYMLLRLKCISFFKRSFTMRH